MNVPTRLGILTQGANRDLLQIRVSGVYAVTNLVTGVRYIGSSKHIGQRWAWHRGFLRHQFAGTVSKIGQDARTYGLEAFAFDLLETVEPDDDALEAAERRWLEDVAKTTPGLLYNKDMTGRRVRRRTRARRPPEGAEEEDA